MFEDVKLKAQWAEAHGFAWFSVMDRLIQIPNVGAPAEPFMEGWTALSAVTSKTRLARLVSSVAYRNPALLAKMAAGVDGSLFKNDQESLELLAGEVRPQFD